LDLDNGVTTADSIGAFSFEAMADADGANARYRELLLP
jgi:hypothetical protein